MKLGYFFIVFFVFLVTFAMPVFAHPGPVDEKGCHECRAEDGCFFYDYWSIPYTMRHCHPELRATSSVALGVSVAPTSSASSTVVGEDEGKSFFASLLSPASWFRSLPRVAQFLLVLLVFSLLYIFWRLFRKKEEE